MGTEHGKHADETTRGGVVAGLGIAAAIGMAIVATTSVGACAPELGNGYEGDEGGGGAAATSDATSTPASGPITASGMTATGAGPATGSASSTTSSPSSSASSGEGGTGPGPGGTGGAGGDDPFCGDGVCSGPESCDTCPDDCVDCGFCGDDDCNDDEDCASCPDDCNDDCGACGNDICEAGESVDCPQDCNPSSTSSASSTGSGSCESGVECGGICCIDPFGPSGGSGLVLCCDPSNVCGVELQPGACIAL